MLFELSLVTRPAYPDTKVDVRQFQSVEPVQANDDERYMRWL